MKKWGLGGENSFWSVAIAIGFYCLILGISIGSMFDKTACTGSDFGCFEFWINRYQTLLTAFGVIFAVAIAKAQMDANRRQHVAQIKRSFQPQLDALSILASFSNTVYETSFESAFLNAEDAKNAFLKNTKLERGDLGSGADLIPPKIITKAQTVIAYNNNAHTYFIDSKEHFCKQEAARGLWKIADNSIVEDLTPLLESASKYSMNKIQGDGLMERAKNSFELGRTAALELKAMVDNEESRLSQYWS